MAIVQVKDATGAVLDYMVAKCQGFESLDSDMWLVRDGISDMPLHAYTPSSDWSQGGPIITHKQIGLDQFKGQPCRAYKRTPARHEHAMFAPEGHPLIAAMRCYVSSVLGDEVEVPDELI